MNIKEHLKSLLKGTLKAKLFYLTVGLFLGAIISSVPWYYAWKKEWKQATAKYYEGILVAPDNLTANGPEKHLSKLKKEDLNLNFTDLNDSTYNIDDFQDKVMVINFFATWCTPCIAEFPSLSSLKDRYQNDNRIAFVVLTNENKRKINSFLERRPELKNLSFYSYNSKNIPDLFIHRGLPTTYILNKNSEIVAVHSGMANWDSKNVTEFIDKLISE